MDTSLQVSAAAAANDDIARLLRDAETLGWNAALYAYFKAQAGRGGVTSEDQRMADWRYLLPAQPGRVALLVGCGWSVVPAALVEDSATLYAVDASPEKVAFLNIRKRQQQLDALNPLHATSWGALPFAAASFDLVALREFQLGGRPASFRQELRHVRRLLKPGGWVQISGANLLSPLALLGMGPRERAARAHSLPGYRRILAREGFDSVQVYAPLPNYDGIPLFYVPLDDGAALRFFFSHLFKLFDRVSPEVRRLYALPYAAAKVGVAAALRLGLTSLAGQLLPGFCLIARRAEGGRDGA